MALESGKVGITLIGPPGSGKSTLANIITKRLTHYSSHDHDDIGLEPTLRSMGYQSIGDAIIKMGDTAFLAFEGEYTKSHYGRGGEGMKFALDNSIFASSGSIIRSRDAIEHIRARTHIIFLDIPHTVVLRQIQERSDGSSRIIGMNGGPNGEQVMSKTLEEELLFRDKLYREYQNSIFNYQAGESPNETAKRLLIQIESILGIE